MSNPFRKARGINDRVLSAALTDHQQTLQRLWHWALRRETTLRYQRWVNVLIFVLLGVLAWTK
jgi:hypothetical protein